MKQKIEQDAWCESRRIVQALVMHEYPNIMTDYRGINTLFNQQTGWLNPPPRHAVWEIKYGDRAPGRPRAYLAAPSSLAAPLQHILSYVISFNVPFWNPRGSIILNGRACGFISQMINLRQKQRSMIITCRSKRISRYTLWKDCRGIMKKKEKKIV